MPEIIDRLASAAKNLIPPAEGATDTHVKRWRLWIAGATFMNAIGLSVHIMLACGFAAPFYPGFAQASEVSTQVAAVTQQVKELTDDFKARRIGALEADILATKEKQCGAAAGVRALYTASLQKMLVEYASLTKNSYPVPDCDSF